ncbi:MAG: extracellular solute-binding protein [Kiritimatiellae bacterium]|nr:extracellular solute-binding protein [Kiritimatiellia bacterium]
MQTGWQSFRGGRWGVVAVAAGLLALWAVVAGATGWVEDTEGKRVVHLTVFELPDASRTDPATRGEVAVQKAFLAAVGPRLAARARARGEGEWEDGGKGVRVVLHRFSGIQVEGVESTLLAIAGNVAPDVLYVNFRQSETYIRQGFLSPLDDYFAEFSPEEASRRVHPRIRPVIERPAPAERDGGEGGGRHHIWALPTEPPLGRVVLWRRDLFERAGVPAPSPDWTWADFKAACAAICDPANGVYGLGLSRGKDESYLWLPFLWGAGDDALAFDEASGTWQAAFATEGGAQALDFYISLTTEPWTDRLGRRRRGYAIKDTAESSQKWRNGQLAMRFAYLDTSLFASINPDLTGIAPMPVGPVCRGTEINSRMMGIFAGVTNAWVRDAAWEYIAWQNSTNAAAIRARHLVEGGMGRFLDPALLEALGYGSVAQDLPPAWRETMRIALDEARPEPYGKNAAVIYDILTEPIRRAEELALSGRLPDEPGARRAALQRLLADAKTRTDAELLGIVPPDEMRWRRLAAVGLLALIVLGILLALRQMARIFWPAQEEKGATKGQEEPLPPGGRTGEGTMAGHGAGERPRKRRRRMPWTAILLLLPAALTILVWAYVPLVRGSLMAFFDYHIFGASRFVWLDNFANLLWDAAWWRALWTSARYAAWVIGLTFLPPIVLAILLQEVPRGKVLYRFLFYLPAAIIGLVGILLWKTFYEPSEAGVLNRLVLATPAWVWLLLTALAVGGGIHLALRFRRHGKNLSALFALVVAGFAAWGAATPLPGIWAAVPRTLSPLPWLAARLPEPVRWLDDSSTALFSCVLPILWAGMGPGCLIYLAALKGIPDELYEAADMDGATFTDKILFVVLPSLRPLVVIQFVGVFIAAWQAEANVLAMTGGAANTEVAGLHVFYKAFLFLRFGPATAAAWMLATLLVGFTLYQLRILGRVTFKANG